MILCLVLLSLLCIQSNAQNTSCSGNKADIIFLLDSSTSEGEVNFRKQLDFVTNFTKGFQIGPDHVQVGIFTFSSTPQVGFYLNRYSDKTSLIQGINSTQYLSGDTYTDKALKLVREDGFIPIHGSRPDVPKILVVMTDGESTDPYKTKSEANILHNTDIKVISIGIGSSVQIDELRTIASDNDHVFTVPSFDSLQSIEHEIQNKTCVDEIKGCSGNKADIIFLLDSSTSEGEVNFRKQLDFVTNFTKGFQIGPDHVQVGIFTFSSTPQVGFYLNRYSDKTSLIQGINSTQYLSGDTYTDKALKLVREDGFIPIHGSRPDVPKILVVMTDGESTDPYKTKSEANILHNTDIKVISIGIGSSVQIDELRTIASDNDHVFTVPSFDSLQSIEHEIQNKTCVDEIKACSGNKADIIFLLDSSTSEGEVNFRKQLDFVTNFTKGFQIGPDHVQVGIFTFSSTPQVGFYLNRYSDKTSLIQGINSTQYLSGNTYTDKALKLVREDGFIPIHGSRTGVPKILVVMTDGESTDPTQTKSEANILHYTVIKVISIGIGSSVQIDELRTIASDNDHVFTVPSFDSLQSIEHEIQNKTCVDVIIDTCDSKQADIVFVLDSSSSEGETDFRKQLELVKNVTETFKIGPNNIQISIVTFSTNVFNEFFLNEYSNKADLLSAIGNVTYYGGGTHTEKALQFVRLNSFKTENGGRQSPVSKLVIVITDGNSYYPSKTKTQAELLQHTGVQVMSVGIGSSITQTELNNIATDQQHVFAVANFDLLNTIQKEVESVACKTTSECGDKPADIVFLLDGSGSEGKDNFQKQIDFVTNFVKSFDVGPSNVQFALVVFSTAARTEFYLNTYSDKASMIARIQATQYNGGSTHTDNALRYTRYFHFTAQHGSRANATKILIMLTDGQSIDTTSTIHEADLLKKEGVKILAVGIGSQVNDNELEGVATDRSHVFTVGNFDLLHTFIDEIKEGSCGEIKPTPSPAPECGKKPADIVFVLDSSSSEGSTNFQTQLDFVRDFIYQFAIGPNAIQVSVVVFSTDSHEEFPLNQYQDQTALLTAVAQIKYITGATYTDKALSYVRQNSFTAAKGARQNSTHLVIVLTDGASTSPADTRREALLLKSQPDKVVISIGIGSYINQTELETIATDRDHALNVKSFDALNSIQSELTYIACKTCDFIAKADIVFVLDASSSEGQTNFDKQLDFVARVANDFNIGPKDVQIGVVTYAYSPNLEFFLNHYSTKSSLLTAIQRIPYTSGNTRTDLAIKYVADQMFLNAHGDRPDANNYVIILTDGASTQPNDTLVEAQKLKQSATVLSIGIGSSVNKDELNGIASDKQHVFTVDSFDALKTIREDVKKAACEVVSSSVTPEYIDIITHPPTVRAN